MSEGKPTITLVAQSDAYFQELVAEALGKQRVSTQPETEFYLVNLLNQFITTDKLFARDQTGAFREEPLALMLKDALEQPQPEAQRILFRHIGDVSLYVAGFFQDSLSRKLVDVDYYIGVGESAYQQVANRMDEDLMRTIYGELSEKFSKFVEVLADVSDKTGLHTEKDILRVYETWLRTRSERAAKALHDAGIVPNDTIKKDWQ